jgi:AcrR family transcriptional regulator
VTEHPSHKLAADKRALLFRVASAEFSANGFKQASLNRIISQIGMSKSSFYHYFSNKADLFQETLEDVLRPIIAARQAIDLEALTVETLWPTVIKVAGEMTQQFNETPEIVSVGRMFHRCLENPEERELTQGIIHEITAWTVQLIQRGQALGMFRKDLPETLLIDILMAMGMSMDRWMLTNWDAYSDAERMELSQKSFGLFVRLLAPET